MSDLKLGVDAQLTSKSALNLQKQLENMKDLSVKIGIDTSEISKSTNKNGIGERTTFQWWMYCAHPSKAA